MNIISLLLLSFLFITSIFPQHLPLKIDNQWHYDCSIVPGTQNYAAVVIGRETINGLEYWKINRYASLTGELIEVVYDRMEGDSLYIRKVACPEELIINFDWPLGHIEITALGSDCYNFKKLISKTSRNVLGFNTTSYQFKLGNYCAGYSDTVWTLFTPEITKELGCYWANDGRLVGAVLNGVSYGTLYPLPVELISFTAAYKNNFVQLIWKTSTETNNSGYEIQRKKYEDNEWEKIAFIEGKGTTTNQQQYLYTDKNITSGTWFYRIIQYDNDGTSKLIAETPVDVIIPDLTQLKQNYPNPFNPATNIEYTLAANVNVKLRIFDIMGREIAMLVNDYQSAGNHKVIFSGNGLSSGIYFYTLEAGKIINTGQMMLLK